MKIKDNNVKTFPVATENNITEFFSVIQQRRSEYLNGSACKIMLYQNAKLTFKFMLALCLKNAKKKAAIHVLYGLNLQNVQNLWKYLMFVSNVVVHLVRSWLTMMLLKSLWNNTQLFDQYAHSEKLLGKPVTRGSKFSKKSIEY